MIFLSILGTEAMAILNPLLSMIGHGKKPEQIVLLVTNYVAEKYDAKWRAVQQRILHKSQKEGWSAKVEIIRISSSLEADYHGPPPQEVAACLARKGLQIAFNLAGGMNFMVAACVRALKDSGGLFLYPEQRRVYAIEKGASTAFAISVWRLPPAEDVLALQGIPHKILPSSNVGLIKKIFRSCDIELPTHEVRAVKIRQMVYDYFFNDQNTMRFMKVLNTRATLRDFRRLAAHVNDRIKYNDLYHKTVAVMTDNIALADRIEMESLRNLHLIRLNGPSYAVDHKRQAMRRFLGFTYDGNQPPQKPEIQPGSYRSALVTILGTDVAPTLIAVWSTKPEHLILLYTPSDATIVRYKETFENYRSLLGVKALSFVPVSYLGHECLSLSRPKADEVVVNIQPGTKGHTAMLTLWAMFNGADIHSLGNQGLYRFNTNSFEPLCAPAPTTALILSGHRILKQGCKGNTLEKSWATNDAVTRLLDMIQISERNIAEQTIKNLFKSDLHLNGVDVVIQGEGIGRKAVIDFYGIEGGKAAISLLNGEWFENYVGYRLLSAGADDVQVRVQTDWSQKVRTRLAKAGGTVTHKTDIDVVARFGSNYVVIECKSGLKANIPAEQTALDIKARAGLFGRYARAMVCILKHDEAPYISSDGVQVFGYRTLIDCNALRDLILEGFTGKQTTRHLRGLVSEKY